MRRPIVLGSLNGFTVSEWMLPCGCVAALGPVGLRLAWAVVSRCDEHPSGDVSVPSMALLSMFTVPDEGRVKPGVEGDR